MVYILTIIHNIMQAIYIDNAIMTQHTLEYGVCHISECRHHILCASVCPVTSVRPIMVSITILLIDHCDGPKSSLHCCIFPVGRYQSIVITFCCESSATYYIYNAAFVIKFMTIIPALSKQYHFISCSSSKKARRSFCSRNIFKHLFHLNVILYWLNILSAP